MMKPTFSPGTNIAIKFPVHEYNSTVAFYRDILGLKPVELESPDNYESIAFEFGDKNLWVDKTSGISQAEIWLEIKTDNLDTGAKILLFYSVNANNLNMGLV